MTPMRKPSNWALKELKPATLTAQPRATRAREAEPSEGLEAKREIALPFAKPIEGRRWLSSGLS